MIVGNTLSVAVESEISVAYERLGFLALGFFVIHVGGRCFGVREHDATLLACSFDEIERRIDYRGKHIATFAELDAEKIAIAFRSAIYGNTPEERYLGISRQDFCDVFYSSHIMWAPDGDEAFDDGSYVLQFDVGNRVRVIAFTSGEGQFIDPLTLREAWLSADEFYGILEQWRSTFKSDWQLLPKEAERGEP